MNEQRVKENGRKRVFVLEIGNRVLFCVKLRGGERDNV